MTDYSLASGVRLWIGTSMWLEWANVAIERTVAARRARKRAVGETETGGKLDAFGKSLRPQSVRSPQQLSLSMPSRTPYRRSIQSTSPFGRRGKEMKGAARSSGPSVPEITSGDLQLE
jgi:hypothetical protein